jgi:hypothetical protein
MVRLERSEAVSPAAAVDIFAVEVVEREKRQLGAAVRIAELQQLEPLLAVAPTLPVEQLQPGAEPVAAEHAGPACAVAA